MFIRYDMAQTDPERLAERIRVLGFQIEVVDEDAKVEDARIDKGRRAPVPSEAPEFFRAAFARARAEGQPVIVDFWAKWCGPCIRMKKETLADARVKKLLEGIQRVIVDLDDHPALGRAYWVEAVPDVVMIDRDGMIVDRVHNFEPPNVFAERLKKLLKESPVERKDVPAGHGP